MSTDNTDYKVVQGLIDFSTGLEGDLNLLSREELHARLEANGIDHAKLASTVRNRLERIQNRILADHSAEVADAKMSVDLFAGPPLSMAARTTEQAAEADLEVLKRLSQPDNDADAEN